MTVYESGRVLTTHELEIGEKIHCGFIAGVCAEWEVIFTAKDAAVIKLGDTTLGVTGTQLRQTHAYHASECPECKICDSPNERSNPDRFDLLERLGGSNIPSSARFINKGGERKSQGGAFIGAKRSTFKK